jgi:transposase
VFLEHLSEKNKEELKIVVLDNGSFHKAKRLEIPENIILIFLPPYSPELNPAEKMWWFIKQFFVCKTFETIEKLSIFLSDTIKEHVNEIDVKRTCNYGYFDLNLLD